MHGEPGPPGLAIAFFRGLARRFGRCHNALPREDGQAGDTTVGNQGTGLQLRSLVKKSGELELSLARVEIPKPGADEILVRIEGTPINPSDLGLLLGPADLSTAKLSANGETPVLTAGIPANLMRAVAGRLDEAMPVGNEGAGVVVDAGEAPAAQALM